MLGDNTVQSSCPAPCDVMRVFMLECPVLHRHAREITGSRHMWFRQPQQGHACRRV